MNNNATTSVLTVSEVNQRVSQHLQTHFGQLWLTGEIAQFTAAASGHWYLTLKDAQSQLACVMFRMDNQRVRFPMKVGLQITALVQLTLYSPSGKYQARMQRVELAGDGLLRAQFEALKQQLFLEGLFASERKKPLPDSIQRVGVITSESGAAFHDILSVFQRRQPHFQVILYPSLVQGADAPRQLKAMLETAIRRQEVDVILLTRGGGSYEDLFCFNDEALARCIAHSPIPVISAVGHEIDVTISDLVADLRAATPTAAAELIAPDKAQQHALWQQIYNRLLTAWQQQLQHKQYAYQQTLMQLQHANPVARIEQQTQQVDHLNQSLHQAMAHYILAKRQDFSQLAGLLNSYSPLNTLSRGYSIGFDENNKVINSVQNVQPGQQLQLQVTDGSIISQVIAVQPNL